MNAMNDLSTTTNLILIDEKQGRKTLIADASDLGWPIGYMPLVIKVDGIFCKMQSKNSFHFKYTDLAGRYWVTIYND